MTLKSRLLERIRSDGPIGFDTFMETALYHPDGGYFTTGPLRSVKAGDFLTSPEVSPMFGETLAVFVDGERNRLHEPPAFTVVEAGGGSGSLLAPLLTAVAGSVEAWAVEASPAARRALELVVPGEVVGTIAELPQRFEGVVIANELLDNLPSAMAVRTPAGWDERLVGESDGALVLVTAPARPEVAAWADRFAGPVTTGSIVEVQIAAGEWLQAALGLLERGAVVVIDYGDTAEALLPRRAQGTIRTYRAHHIGPDPLDEPGGADITADVNFTALVAVAEEAGAAVEIHRQDDFLGGLGLRTRLSELRHQELELARTDDAVARLRVRSRRIEAETLLHPRGLGDFRVMVARVGNRPTGPGVPWT